MDRSTSIAIKSRRGRLGLDIVGIVFSFNELDEILDQWRGFFWVRSTMRVSGHTLTWSLFLEMLSIGDGDQTYVSSYLSSSPSHFIIGDNIVN